MIRFEESSTSKINDYFKLYKKVFKTKKNENYYDWLYYQNPAGNFIGIDCYDDYELIGQVGGIPQEYIHSGIQIRFVLSINVCVDPRHQGKGLFNKMACKLEEVAKEKNFHGIIAIANKAATPAWKKSINLNFLKQLDVLIGYGGINYNKFSKNDYNFYSTWNNEKLNWRLNNPSNETFFINSNSIKSVYSKTNYPFIEVYSPLIFYDDNIELTRIKKKTFKPVIFIGSTKNMNKKFLFRFPEILKPSPLNFLYKFIQSSEVLDSEKVFFTFLDFDAF